MLLIEKSFHPSPFGLKTTASNNEQVGFAGSYPLRLAKRPRQSQPQTRVRFQEEVTEIRVPKSEREDWINDETFVKFLKKTRRKSDIYKQNRPEYAQAIRDLGLKGSRDTWKNIKLLARSEVRGLEQFVAKDLRQNRKRAVNHILLMQQKLRKDGLVNFETMSYLLRGKSKELSQSSRYRAYHLAKADRLWANTVFSR